VSEATQSISYAAMADRQQALGAAILPIRTSQSFLLHRRRWSNVTLNSGRFLINLKRAASAARRHRDCPPVEDEIAGVAGITLYMQPVQDLTLDATVSRTQYQFTLQASDTAALPPGRAAVAQLSTLPEFADVTSNQRTMAVRRGGH